MTDITTVLVLIIIFLVVILRANSESESYRGAQGDPDYVFREIPPDDRIFTWHNLGILFGLVWLVTGVGGALYVTYLKVIKPVCQFLF